MLSVGLELGWDHCCLYSTSAQAAGVTAAATETAGGGGDTLGSRAEDTAGAGGGVLLGPAEVGGSCGLYTSSTGISVSTVQS